MNERDFLETLKKRAHEQKDFVETVPFPSIFKFIVEWLSVHPWRFLIPLALLITIFLRLIFGIRYTNDILWLFRWLS